MSIKQIEEAFRDLKNTRHGFSLRQCRSYTVERLNIALLVAALATFVLWVLGTAAKQKQLHYSFQANTEKRRNVLSNFTISWQALQRAFNLVQENSFLRYKLLFYQRMRRLYYVKSCGEPTGSSLKILN